MRKVKTISSAEIRKSFLDFFHSKGHKILPSSSLIPDDPQLLFTVAGMVPFKKIFWGLQKPKYTRVATVQKCLRTNDIDNVGRTPRHQTMFEMLGNFSFGDYYKREAIEYAWEYLVKVLAIPKERLWVSVYEDDNEAYEIWTKEIGIDERKVIRMGKEDNFWGPVGPSGPCGPDSEIFFDTMKTDNCPEDCTPACDCDRFLEVWNLVFTGLYQDEKGNLGELERKNIDTGMGLERITAVMQGVESVFDTDIFEPFIEKCESFSNVEYGKNEKSDVSMRVISDHSRAAAFLVADGVFPSNTGRGYVLRRLIRRAVRHGKLLGINEPFLYEFVDVVEEKMGEFYPELTQRSELIRQMIKEEEERFFKTLDQGLAMIEKIISHTSVISGSDAFKLYDTYGMPLDITIEIAREKGVRVDVDGFESLMSEQRERARKSRGETVFVSNVYESLAKINTKFVGYDRLKENARVVAIVFNDESAHLLKEGETGEIVLDKSPFYAEKGGQIGDKGTIVWQNGRAEVEDTYFRSTTHVHKVKIISGTLKIDDEVICQVDENRRKAIARNHTATHLLHSALRKVLGDHVKQAGSLVTNEKLRFDFTHLKPLSSDEIEKVEEIVNTVVLEAIKVSTEVMSLEEAKKSGAMALFNEKYAEEVRVVSVGGFSKELCGGTHVSNSGEIGPFVVTEEKGVAAGVRRIEALTGENSLGYLKNLRRSLKKMASRLNVSQDMLERRVEELAEENEKLLLKLSKMEEEEVMRRLKDILKESENSVSNFLVFDAGDVSISRARNIADIIVNSSKKTAIVIFLRGGKSAFVVKSNGKEKANEIARKIGGAFNGKGGGREELAQGGWPQKVNASEVKKILEV